MQTPSLHFLWKADIITTYLRGNCETDKLAEYSHSLEFRNCLYRYLVIREIVSVIINPSAPLTGHLSHLLP